MVRRFFWWGLVEAIPDCVSRTKKSPKTEEEGCLSREREACLLVDCWFIWPPVLIRVLAGFFPCRSGSRPSPGTASFRSAVATSVRFFFPPLGMPEYCCLRGLRSGRVGIGGKFCGGLGGYCAFCITLGGCRHTSSVGEWPFRGMGGARCNGWLHGSGWKVIPGRV